MKILQYLIESVIMEDAALTKGSQRVMNDKNLVAGLADAVRDDSRSHPQNFPAGFNRTSQKTPDEGLAQWFLENIDKIEKQGYEGTVYSRDGVNSDWIVRRYIAGSHNWEDLIGVMNMNLRDWYLLKNRDMLDPNHRDIPKFNSVRDIGKYMSTHYHDKLDDIRSAAALAAVKKQSKLAKVVDNDDYKIYTVFNWAGARTVGNGTQWCTANSQSRTNYENYSKSGMLFQLFPKDPEHVDKTGGVIGKRTVGPEKYQFDAGSGSFNDIADDVVGSNVISKKFPYLYSDLLAGLKQHKGELQTAIDTMVADETLKTPETKVQPYKIDDEITKLKRFKEKGYFTDKVRPKAVSSKDDSEQEQPQISPPAEQPAPMENIRELARKMLEGIVLSEPDADDEPDKKELGEEGDEMDDTGIAPPSASSSGLGSMGGGAGPTGGGGQYPPGTAPTMPESFINKGNIMENNVDKDVAAMLTSLKKYDKLVESVAPVMGMVTLGEKKGELPPWLKDKKDEKADPKDGADPEDFDDFNESKKVEEGVDPDVLAWMGRFAKLGNMKGYAR